MPNALEVKELRKIYQLPRAAQKAGQKTFAAVRGISFSVEEGEIFGILGPNGAGKTTTLEILETLKKPSGGEVLVLGLNALKFGHQIKSNIGVQLQSSNYLDNITLAEQLTLLGALYGKKVNPDELLAYVRLQEKKHALVKNLSGGQKQRFTLATALVNEPKILFLDEPTTGLDPRARREVWQLIKQINQKGITILLTTHYMEEAEYLCHRVAIMDQGKILTIDNPRRLIDNLANTSQVSFFSQENVAADLWQKIPAVAKVYSNFPKTILEITDLAAVNEILQTLKNNGLTFTGFTVKTATLEDVYLDLTGKEFAQND